MTQHMSEKVRDRSPERSPARMAPHRPQRAVWTAAVVACLAGTALGAGALAQQQQPPAGTTPTAPAPAPSSATTPAPAPARSGASAPAPRQAGTAAPSQGRTSAPPSAAGKSATYHQAEAPTSQARGGMRNPLDEKSREMEGKVRVDENNTVDIHVNEEDLSNVLQMLSMQSQKNIVVSRNVTASVTTNLYNVTFYEALDAILHINGFGYIERGNFIYVYTLDEITQINEQTRPRVWKIMPLSYLNSIDAAEFVKPLLSTGGQIKTNGKVENFSIPENAPVGADNYAANATLLVFDFEENVNEIEALLKQIDTRPSQVLVEATILQTALTEANAFGVDFSILGDLNFGEFVRVGGPLKAVDALIGGSSTGTASGGASATGSSGTTGATGTGTAAASPFPSDGQGRAIVSSPGNTAGPGTLKLGIVQNDVAAFLKLLDQVSDTTILSRPNILTLNRQPARVLVGRKVGYLNTTATTTSTTQTVQFLDTGTQLYFRPFVSADGMIRMELKPKVSEAVIRNVTNATGAAVTIPDEISNELTANVMVRDGQTVVLGGLFRESTAATRRQVPFLGDVPLIGAAFRGHDDETQRNEIIFMITPTIVSDANLATGGERATAQVARVRAGTREGLLPWSREKRTSQLLVDAERLASEGKTQSALNRVQRALALNPFQPDVIQVRERLMKNSKVWPDRSLMSEVMYGEIEKKLQSARSVDAGGSSTGKSTGKAGRLSSTSDRTGDAGSGKSTPHALTPAPGSATASAAASADEPGFDPTDRGGMQFDWTKIVSETECEPGETLPVSGGASAAASGPASTGAGGTGSFDRTGGSPFSTAASSPRLSPAQGQTQSQLLPTERPVRAAAAQPLMPFGRLWSVFRSADDARSSVQPTPESSFSSVPTDPASSAGGQP